MSSHRSVRFVARGVTIDALGEHPAFKADPISERRCCVVARLAYRTYGAVTKGVSLYGGTDDSNPSRAPFIKRKILRINSDCESASDRDPIADAV
jgi:hypothetical protein